MIRSAYIHIPFCTHKCDFCDFAAFSGMDHLEDEYTDALCEEIRVRLRPRNSRDELVSIFYGGGTPGLVKPETLQRIHDTLLQFVSLSGDAEISMETTPHSIEKSKAEKWLKLGINRLSIGIESLDDAELRAIGRDHDSAQARQGIKLAAESGFQNISCDFMYALPTQSVETWKHTLEAFLDLSKKYDQIKHVSAYGLHLETNSPLYSRFPKDSAQYPDDDSYGEMYAVMVELLEAGGFHQYEVSNFSRPGFESVHNQTYWRNRPYYAFGVGAHRFVDGVRSANWRSLRRYMRDFAADEFSEIIEPAVAAREALMLALRMRAGLDLDEYQVTHGIDLAAAKTREIAKLTECGLIEIADGKLRITPRGLPVSNTVIGELM